MYACKDKSSKSTFREIFNKYEDLFEVIKELQIAFGQFPKSSMLGSVLANMTDAKLHFIRNKVTHHDYYIVTERRNGKMGVKVILFVHKHDINNPQNFYIKIGKIGEYVRWVKDLIIVLISSINIFVLRSIGDLGLRLDDISKRCEFCGNWRTDFSKEFKEECQIYLKIL